jgi:hypothetical protein
MIKYSNYIIALKGYIPDRVIKISEMLKKDCIFFFLLKVSGISKESEVTKQDLRSRGLCLVPVASTYPVASETTTDFWYPTFGGTFR